MGRKLSTRMNASMRRATKRQIRRDFEQLGSNNNINNQIPDVNKKFSQTKNNINLSSKDKQIIICFVVLFICSIFFPPLFFLTFIYLFIIIIQKILYPQNKKKESGNNENENINFNSSKDLDTENNNQKIYHCPNCGNEIDKSNSFCPNCGTKIKIQTEDNQQKDTKPITDSKIINLLIEIFHTKFGRTINILLSIALIFFIPNILILIDITNYQYYNIFQGLRFIGIILFLYVLWDIRNDNLYERNKEIYINSFSDFYKTGAGKTILLFLAFSLISFINGPNNSIVNASRFIGFILLYI